MKKTSLLLLCSVLLSGTCVGCSPYEISEETAIQLTQEYMKEKYEKDIKNISARVNSRGGQHNVEVHFQVDDESEDNHIYEVCVEVDEKDKKTHYVKCDDYMNVLIEPILIEGLINILEENGFEEFSIYVLGAEQPHLGTSGGFLSEFTIPQQSDQFEKIMQSGTLYFRFEIFIPQSEYDEGAYSKLETLVSGLVDDDIIWVYVAECSNVDYLEIKHSIFENNEAELYEVLMSNSSFGDRFVSFHEIKINQPDQ